MADCLAVMPRRLMSQDGRRLSWLGYLLLALFCFALYIPGQVTLPPTDRDESSFAQATKQMVETGNYVDIRLQDKPRYQKPIGIYWLQAASVKLFNPASLNEIWAYRVPSLLAAGIAVLATAAIGSLLFDPLIGLLCGLMLAGCVSLNVEAHLAKTDATLLACICVMQYALARAYRQALPGWGVFLTFWLALGLGILVKGPIILLVLFGTLLWLRVTEKQAGWFKSLRPLLGLPLLLLVIVPWFTAIMLASHGAFAQQSAGHDMMQKLWQGQGRGIMPPGLHLLVLPAMFFPFSIFAMLGGIDAWHLRRDSAVRFCLGWIVPTWIVFEISFTKLPHYVLPTYPAIAMLAAKGLLDGYPRLVLANRRWLMALTVLAWLLVGMGFAVIFGGLPWFLDHKIIWPQIGAGLALLALQGIALYLIVSGRRPAAVLALALASLLFLPTVLGVTLPRLEHLWPSRQIVQTVAEVKPCPDPQIVATGYGEPSLVFMAGTHTLLTGTAPDAASALQTGLCRVAVVNDKKREDFLAAFAQPPRELAVIDGINTGSKGQRHLYLYAAP